MRESCRQTTSLSTSPHHLTLHFTQHSSASPCPTPAPPPLCSMFYSSSASAQQYYLANVKKGQVGEVAMAVSVGVELEQAFAPSPRCRSVWPSSPMTTRGIGPRLLVYLTRTGSLFGMLTTGTLPQCLAWRLEEPSKWHQPSAV